MNLIDIDLKEMTEQKWNTIFEEIRSQIKPSKDKKMKSRSSYEQTNYDGETQWYRYCQFINETLSAIRNGESEYCFYPYQVAELLRFEPDRLIAKWLPNDKCFLVYLDKNNKINMQ